MPSNTFTCCELVKKIKTHQAQSNWKIKEKHLANEFLYKATYESLCEECKKWFTSQFSEQMKLIETEREKDKKKGKDFFTEYPDEIKEGSVMDEAMKMREEAKKKLGQSVSDNSRRNNSLPFGKSPQE